MKPPLLIRTLWLDGRIRGSPHCVPGFLIRTLLKGGRIRGGMGAVPVHSYQTGSTSLGRVGSPRCYWGMSRHWSSAWRPWACPGLPWWSRSWGRAGRSTRGWGNHTETPPSSLGTAQRWGGGWGGRGGATPTSWSSAVRFTSNPL